MLHFNHLTEFRIHLTTHWKRKWNPLEQEITSDESEYFQGQLPTNNSNKHSRTMFMVSFWFIYCQLFEQIPSTFSISLKSWFETQHTLYLKSSHSKMFCEKVVRKGWTKFQRKHLRWDPFIRKVSSPNFASNVERIN